MTGMGMGLASSRNRCFQREFQNLGSFPSLLGEIHLNPLFLKCLDELPNFFPRFRGQFLHPGPGMLGAGGRSQGSRLPGSRTRSETMKKLKDHHFFGGYIGNIVGISWDIDIYHWDIMGIVWILFKPDDLMSRHHWNDGTCKQHLPSGNLT